MKHEKVSYLVKRLKAARQESIERASEARAYDIAKWAKWELRKEYLTQRINHYEKIAISGSNIPKRVFISYKKENEQKGNKYQQILQRKLKEEGFSTTDGFLTTDGFERKKKIGGNILRRVLSRMKTSTIYVGIYTKENTVNINNESYWMPSVWTIEEKGMALGLNLPVLLILEEGIHQSFFSKTTGAFEHCIVKNEHHFEHEVVDLAYQLILDKYLHLKEKDGLDKDSNNFEF